MVDALVGAIINRLWVNARIRMYVIWHDSIFIDNDIFIVHGDILNRRLRDMETIDTLRLSMIVS